MWQAEPETHDTPTPIDTDTFSPVPLNTPAVPTRDAAKPRASRDGAAAGPEASPAAAPD